jgi:hypothetical protein
VPGYGHNENVNALFEYVLTEMEQKQQKYLELENTTLIHQIPGCLPPIPETHVSEVMNKICALIKNEMEKKRTNWESLFKNEDGKCKIDVEKMIQIITENVQMKPFKVPANIILTGFMKDMVQYNGTIDKTIHRDSVLAILGLFKLYTYIYNN